MSTVQLVAIAAVVLGGAAYIWRGVKRTLRADAAFFTDLVQGLRTILDAKGFRLVRHVHMPKSFGHRIASFEGPSFMVDAAWDGKEREILLLQRDSNQPNVAAGERLAVVHTPQGASDDVYARASAEILSVAASIGRSEPLPS